MLNKLERIDIAEKIAELRSQKCFEIEEVLKVYRQVLSEGTTTQQKEMNQLIVELGIKDLLDEPVEG